MKVCAVVCLDHTSRPILVWFCRAVVPALVLNACIDAYMAVNRGLPEGNWNAATVKTDKENTMAFALVRVSLRGGGQVAFDRNISFEVVGNAFVRFRMSLGSRPVPFSDDLRLKVDEAVARRFSEPAAAGEPEPPSISDLLYEAVEWHDRNGGMKVIHLPFCALTVPIDAIGPVACTVFTHFADARPCAGVVRNGLDKDKSGKREVAR